MNIFVCFRYKMRFRNIKGSLSDKISAISMFGGTHAAVVVSWVPLLHGKYLFKYHIMSQKGGSERVMPMNYLLGKFCDKRSEGFSKVHK